MNKLIQELQRLYFVGDQRGFCLRADAGVPWAGGVPAVLTPAQLAEGMAGECGVVLDLMDDTLCMRAMVIGVTRTGDWEILADLYRGLQEDLELPAPAISVSATTGFQLWLSLAEGVKQDEARWFVEALRANYLADIPLAKLELVPGADEAAAGAANQVELVPAYCPGSGKWSAFIDPSMGGMFVDESGLDMAPNMERQADMLAAVRSIKAAEFRRACERLAPPAAMAPVSGELAQAPAAGRRHATLDIGSHFTDPKAFLLAVMNDPSATAGQRIKAAKALLPYFNDVGHS